MTAVLESNNADRRMLCYAPYTCLRGFSAPIVNSFFLFEADEQFFF